MSIPIGARVWALRVDGAFIELVAGIVRSLRTDEHGPRIEVEYRTEEETLSSLFRGEDEVVLDEDADTLALSPGHHESGLRRLVGEAVTAIRLEARLDQLDPSAVDAPRILLGPQGPGFGLARMESMEDIAARDAARAALLAEAVAAGLVQVWPGDETPPELTELGHALARRLAGA